MCRRSASNFPKMPEERRVFDVCLFVDTVDTLQQFLLFMFFYREIYQNYVLIDYLKKFHAKTFKGIVLILFLK